MTTFAMETADISMTQESLHIKITNEDNACHFEFIPQDQMVTKLIMWKY
jgi:hypothetical protein